MYKNQTLGYIYFLASARTLHRQRYLKFEPDYIWATVSFPACVYVFISLVQYTHSL
jgi:hypothetical protein